MLKRSTVFSCEPFLPFYLGGLVEALNRANGESRESARSLLEVSHQATRSFAFRFRGARSLRSYTPTN